MRKTFLLLIAALLWAAPSWASLGVVQAKSGDAATATAVTITVTTSANNLLVIICGQDANNTSTLSVADSASNSWVQAGTYNRPSTSKDVAIFFATNAAAITTLTATWSGSISANVSATVYEISGADTVSPLDANGANASNGSPVATLTSGSLTTTNANDILLFGIYFSAVVSAQTAGTSFAFQSGGTGSRVGMDFEIVSSIQTAVTTTTTWTTNARPTGNFVSFKAASGAAPPAGVNKRIKLEQLDNLTAVLSGGGFEATANEPGLATGPCNPADLTCVEYLNVCFADGICHPILVGDKPAAVSIVKTWAPGGVPQITTTPILSVTALPNAAVP